MGILCGSVLSGSLVSLIYLPGPFLPFSFSPFKVCLSPFDFPFAFSFSFSRSFPFSFSFSLSRSLPRFPSCPRLVLPPLRVPSSSLSLPSPPPLARGFPLLPRKNSLLIGILCRALSGKISFDSPMMTLGCRQCCSVTGSKAKV